MESTNHCFFSSYTQLRRCVECNCTADTFSHLDSLAIANDSSSLPKGEARATYTYPATIISAREVRCYFFVRIPRCIVAGIVLGKIRNKRSHRAIRTIDNDACTYVNGNNAFPHIFVAPSVHGMYTVLTVGMKFMDRRGIVLWKLVGIYSHILALVATLRIVTIAR